MRKKKIMETYEVNVHLYTLQDVLFALQENGRKFYYPEDINKSIDELLKKIDLPNNPTSQRSQSHWQALRTHGRFQGVREVSRHR